MNISIQFRRFAKLSNWLLILLLGGGCVACTATATSRGHIAASSILDKVRNGKPVLVENMTIEGDLDFTTLPANPETETVSKAYITVPVFFKDCAFEGKVMAFRQDTAQTVLCHFEKNLTFLNCKFNSEVDFQSLSVEGIAFFSKSHFNRLTSFENARFGSEAYFDETLFAQEARFQRASFERRANFWHSVWAGVTYFQGAIFRNDTQFNLADFRGNLDFSLCSTDGLLNFNYAQFTGKCIFDNCRFRNAVDFNNTTMPEASLKEVVFDTRASFLDIKSQSISFENAVFLSQKPAIKLVQPIPNAVNLTGAKVALSETVLLRQPGKL